MNHLGVHPNPFAGTPSQALAAMSPPSSNRPFRGPFDTLQMMADLALGDRGEKSVLVRQFTEVLVREIQPKDYLGEILAIRNVFVQPPPVITGAPALFRYTNDPRHVEMVKDPERIVHEIVLYGASTIDCDESAMLAGTMALCVGREVEFVAMGFSPRELSHVAVRVKEPKSGAWILLDGVAGPREKEAADRAKELLYWSLD